MSMNHKCWDWSFSSQLLDLVDSISLNILFLIAIEISDFRNCLKSLFFLNLKSSHFKFLEKFSMKFSLMQKVDLSEVGVIFFFKEKNFSSFVEIISLWNLLWIPLFKANPSWFESSATFPEWFPPLEEKHLLRDELRNYLLLNSQGIFLSTNSSN